MWPLNNKRLAVPSDRRFCRNSPLVVISTMYVLRRGVWPSTLNWIIVSDDFEHSTVGITSSFFSRVSNRGVNVLYFVAISSCCCFSRGGGRRAYSYYVACIIHILANDHAPLSRRRGGRSHYILPGSSYTLNMS